MLAMRAQTRSSEQKRTSGNESGGKKNELRVAQLFRLALCSGVHALHNFDVL